MPAVAVGELHLGGKLQVEDAAVGGVAGRGGDAGVREEGPHGEHVASRGQHGDGLGQGGRVSRAVRSGQNLERAVVGSRRVEMNPQGEHLVQEFVGGLDVGDAPFGRGIAKVCRRQVVILDGDRQVLMPSETPSGVRRLVEEEAADEAEARAERGGKQFDQSRLLPEDARPRVKREEIAGTVEGAARSAEGRPLQAASGKCCGELLGDLSALSGGIDVLYEGETDIGELLAQLLAAA